MQKTLDELFSEKALSLMGDRRIKLIGYPEPGKGGEIVGVEHYNADDHNPCQLKIVLDDKSTIAMLLSDYLRNFKYAHPEGGIKAALSIAGKEALKATGPYADRFKKLDVVHNDHDFKVYRRASPQYVAWEMIKAADQVSVISKVFAGEDSSDQFLIEAQTPRGLFAQQQTSCPPALYSS